MHGDLEDWIRMSRWPKLGAGHGEGAVEVQRGSPPTGAEIGRYFSVNQKSPISAKDTNTQLRLAGVEESPAGHRNAIRPYCPTTL